MKLVRNVFSISVSHHGRTMFTQNAELRKVNGSDQGITSMLAKNGIQLPLVKCA